MAKWLRSIQEDGGEDFEDEAAEWKAKTTHNSFAEFKQYFIDRDLVVRDRDKHKKTKAKDAGFHSTNSAQEIEDRITDKMVMALQELAVATEETINLAVGSKPTPRRRRNAERQAGRGPPRAHQGSCRPQEETPRHVRATDRPGAPVLGAGHHVSGVFSVPFQ